MQPHYYSRALSLADTDAPAHAKAMALLLSWHKDRDALSKSRGSRYLHMSEEAAADNPAVVLPEIHKILDLEASLPHAIRSRRLDKDHGARAAVAANAARAKRGTLDDRLTPLQGPTVAWPLEGLTPWITSSTSFCEAAAFADNPARWHEAAAQVEVKHCTHLPPDGARWRKRLTKETDFGMPLVSNLVARDTIDITAEGHDARDGSGFRRYTYVLHSSAGIPGYLDITRDEGCIEIAGDAHGVQIRIEKRVTVIRPVNDDLAGILSAGFLAELWLWAIGFCVAVGKPNQQPIGPPLVRQANDKPIRKRAAAQQNYEVCVMGGGPAGLACAWLLSNPQFTNRSTNKAEAAWVDNGTQVKVAVTLIEKAYLPGGKAASGRRVDGDRYRIEEHGLHMAFGCYPNLLKMLESIGAEKNLEPIQKVKIPCGRNPLDVNDAFTLELKPWATKDAPQQRDALMSWIDTKAPARLAARQPVAGANVNGGAEHTAETETEALWNSADDTMAVVKKTRPRPIMRMCAAATGLLSAWQPKERAMTHRHLAMAALGKTVSLAASSEISLGAADVGRNNVGLAAGELASLAALMRSFARAALPWNKGDRDERLAGEMLEFATTAVIGLAADAAIPMWALDQPGEILTTPDYAQWVRLIQKKLDPMTLADWLNKHGVAPGFALESRLIGAVTAGLFTGADRIGAGTFVNGFLRLFLTYTDVPFYHFKNGTGEAVIAPIFESVKNKIRIEMETAVQGIEMQGNKALRATVGPNPVPAANQEPKSARAHSQVDGNFQDFREFTACGGGQGWAIRTGLPVLASRAQQAKAPITADIFVLAIPPFGQPIPGLPKLLADNLARIQHTATISLQCWTSEAPKLPGALVSGFATPFRCVSAMGQLKEVGGVKRSRFARAPVYYCGDIPMAEEQLWPDSKFDDWIKSYASIMQDGECRSYYGRVNAVQSERYVDASPATQSVRRYVFETGIDNLWLAGDWTRTALNCGSIEAAITSGLEAARDILQQLGCTVNFPIAGSILD